MSVAPLASPPLVTAASPAPDEAYRSEWGPLEQEPGRLVFLLGCQRSGTTWLHLQLARTGAFRFVTAYDVHAGESLVHNDRLGVRDGARRALEAAIASAGDRGIDAIPAHADTPEEYGLLIGDGSLRYDRPDTTPETLPRLRALCAKKALLEGIERPLLLKSPPDYPAGVELLAATWPGARFVIIHRHPLRTLGSQVRAWRSLLSRRNDYLTAIDPGYRALFADAGARMRLGFFLHSRAGIDWLADSVLRAHRGFLAMLDSGSVPAHLSVRYEDLCADQPSSFARLSRFLEMDLPRPAEAPAPRGEVAPDGVREAFMARLDGFAPYLAHFGYHTAAGEA